ncbi:hypothetical protein LCGC14_1919710 [marine sediment metagenome]|uniref:Uncharacterized protein n=1 Tax=marine sediment metagenome TaxID=412755 RepID=A0A0F9INX7_9ZZZZ
MLIENYYLEGGLSDGQIDVMTEKSTRFGGESRDICAS